MFGDLIEMMSGQGPDVATRLKKRRASLLELVAAQYPDKKGSVLLFAPMELDHQNFVQDSSFYYFSGISEPATVLSFAVGKSTMLFEPYFSDVRAQWVHSLHVINNQTKSLYGIDEIVKAGDQLAGYQIDPYFSSADFKHLIDHLRLMVANRETIFTLYPVHGRLNARVKMFVDRLALFVPGLMNHVVDISDLVGKLRRKKDMSEIEAMYQAVAVTQAAFQAAAHVIKPGVSEAVIQAAMEYIFTENGTIPAYSTIVGGGKRATILHYTTNQEQLASGELVLIDAGAMYQHYCADITRVFPVAGKFSKQQAKLYEIVLATQEHVVEHIRPGVWLSNPQEQDVSLQHIALNFLKKHGYEQYFIHGIGHYLGLDVHDVGSRQEPLQEGDVITIEPGIYIPEESIGIRIEDNYWIISDAAPVCISEDIPKSIVEIEQVVQQSF